MAAVPTAAAREQAALEASVATIEADIEASAAVINRLRAVAARVDAAIRRKLYVISVMCMMQVWITVSLIIAPPFKFTIDDVDRSVALDAGIAMFDFRRFMAPAFVRPFYDWSEGFQMLTCLSCGVSEWYALTVGIMSGILALMFAMVNVMLRICFEAIVIVYVELQRYLNHSTISDAATSLANRIWEQPVGTAVLLAWTWLTMRIMYTACQLLRVSVMLALRTIALRPSVSAIFTLDNNTTFGLPSTTAAAPPLRPSSSRSSAVSISTLEDDTTFGSTLATPTYKNSNDDKATAIVSSGTVPKEFLCCICVTRLRTVCFEPCNHVVACVPCTVAMVKRDSRCPVCRTDVSHVRKLFF